MNSFYSNIFKYEESIFKAAEELIERNEYSGNPLLDKYISLAADYGKVLKEFIKVVKISDGQQEYLQRIQLDLKKEIEERKKIEVKLHYLATTDSLTGVNNRALGISILENQIRLQKRTKDIFSVCFIDVNGLKAINDKYGHFKGDEVLVEICKFIKSDIRDCDIMCRMGGDEFLIIFPQCSKKSVEAVMDRILSAINNENVKKRIPYEISFSYGAVEIDENHSKSTDEIIDMADKKMYEHKQKYKSGLISNISS